ncbi:Antitoxin component YwqK of the YwqJK toxin-antitoxin module [Anaerobranca californiensis DSM 14826]|jgi:antitoxin component YwqK of YwqJK toxin-antitoxin module|uniref:Antitoxin component YwqK of the YwqJK toxin-antitoxin module n=1 Tax=Anaerobranca californiensis DSM 14826 TaxID=1120989 RepID=A0A1M6K8B6_9FIRM|nr:hypothetical protein [Anaerobranca californiensis]SHJ55208.1 Antitoxin component YwqK of the YwqJK toxin-antitoxin module [Anaerobranca californiensis DSM 14826]
MNQELFYELSPRRRRKKSKLLLYLIIIAAIITSTFILPNPGNTLYYLNGNVKSLSSNNTITLFYPDGTIFYHGEFHQGLAHGYGKYYDENGILLYEGNWENGFITGYGYDFYPNGEIKYKGYWKNGHYHGEGTKFAEDGQILYQGGWNFGLPHGQGKLFENGNLRYSGEFVNALKHGYGEEFLNGKLHYRGLWFEGNYFKTFENFFLPNGAKLPPSLGRYYLQVLLEKSYEEAINRITPLAKHIDTIEKSSENTYFKYLLYQHLELPDSYNPDTIKRIIREMESVPISIFEVLVALGVKHRFITGNIGRQEEFKDVSGSIRGIPLSQASGITSTSHKLMVTRLDRNNPAATALHELGHGVDFFLLNYISNTPEFEELRKKEGAKMFQNPYLNTRYFIDYHEEYFAEFFAQLFLSDELKLFGGAKNLTEIKERAPETYQFFSQHVLEYQSKYTIPKESPFDKLNDKIVVDVEFFIKEIKEDTIDLKITVDLNKTYSLFLYPSSSNLEELNSKFNMGYDEIINLIYKEENLITDLSFRNTKDNIIYLIVDEDYNYSLGEVKEIHPREKYYKNKTLNPLEITTRQPLILYSIGRFMKFIKDLN